MGPRLFALLPCATYALAQLACTGESSFSIPPWDASAPDTRYESACAAWAKTRCTYERRCTVSIFFRWADPQQCIERAILECELEASDPNVAFDPGIVARCPYPGPNSDAGDPSDAGTSTGCSAPVPGLCLAPGKAAQGATCLWDDACASGLCEHAFRDNVQSPCGTCAPRRSCPACTTDQLCADDGDGGLRCMSVPTLGQKCGPPLYACKLSVCQVPNNETYGECKPIAASGEKCGDGTTGPPCVDFSAETYCDVMHTPNVCKPYQPAGYGKPCASATGGDGFLCTAYGNCDFNNTGLCIPPSPDGEPCDERQGLACLRPARCLANHCVFPSQASCSL